MAIAERNTKAKSSTEQKKSDRKQERLNSEQTGDRFGGVLTGDVIRTPIPVTVFGSGGVWMYVAPGRGLSDAMAD